MDTITPEPRPCQVAGAGEHGAATLTVTHPYDGSPVADVALPAPEQLERALNAAAAREGELARSAPGRRAEALGYAAGAVTDRAEELAELITAESGKPITDSACEVARTAAVLRAGAATAGHTDPPRAPTAGLPGQPLVLSHRAPLGPVLGTTSAGRPLTDAAVPLAAALAAGAPVLLVPDRRSPLSALVLAEILAETDLPGAALSALPLDAQALAAAAGDERIGVVSLAGGPVRPEEVPPLARGTRLHRREAGHATAIVLADWTDLAGAAARIAASATCHAGQVAPATRRVLVAEAVAGPFGEHLAAALSGRAAGSPYDEDVAVGPLLEERLAQSAIAAITETVSAGAQLVTGGERAGAAIRPTLLAEVPLAAPVGHEHILAPLVTVASVGSPAEAFDLARTHDANPPAGGTAGGHTAVFTRDMGHAYRAAAELATSVTIGDVSHLGTPEAGELTAAAAEIRELRSLLRAATEERVTVVAVPDA